jgi:uncharacterized C2H2 Zn-finger protein
MMCSKIFPSVSTLRRHLKEVHQTNIRFFCEVCRTGYVTYDEWKQHMKTHRRDTESNFECEMCGKMFKTPDYLYYHKYYYHSDRLSQPKNESCDICGKMFRSKQGVANHKSKGHRELMEQEQEVEYIVDETEGEIEYLLE